jgi:hypothetical protein
MKPGDKVDEDNRKKLQIDKRIDILYPWLEAAELIAKETKNKEATAALDFLKGRDAFGIVNRKPGYIDNFFSKPVPDEEVSNYIFLVPFLTEDAERMNDDDERLGFIFGGMSQVARYNEGSHTIYLSMEGNDATTFTKGLLLLHELMHAKCDFEGKHRDKNGEQTEFGHWLEEAEIYIAELQMVEKLLGAKYKRLVNRLSAAALKTVKDVKDLQVRVGIKDLAVFKEEFGDHWNDFEETMLATLVGLDVAAHVIKKLHPKIFLQSFAHFVQYNHYGPYGVTI